MRWRDVAVVALGEEVAQAELVELTLDQVRLEAEDLREVVRADLDARLADLVGGFRHRMLLLLGDQDGDVRVLLAQLTGEAEAGEAPAGDDHVVGRQGHAVGSGTGDRDVGTAAW